MEHGDDTAGDPRMKQTMKEIRAGREKVQQQNGLPTSSYWECRSKGFPSPPLVLLSKHLVGLAFFDDRVDAAVKKEMVKNLQHLPKPKASRDLKVEDSTIRALWTPS